MGVAFKNSNQIFRLETVAFLIKQSILQEEKNEGGMFKSMC